MSRRKLKTMAVEQKRFETRSWQTSYRGPIAIHVAKKQVPGALYPEELSETQVREFLKDIGCVVALAELAGCYKIMRHGAGVCIDIKGKIFKPSPKEIAPGDWTPGRFAWDMQNVMRIAAPIPAKGMQGLWTWKLT